MKIALDYDQTFTADRDLWIPFVALAQMRGHEVAFVTFRPPAFGNDDIEADAKRLGIPVVYSAGRQKSHCHDADVWIDDMPELIPSADMMRGMLAGCDAMGDAK